jgi:hypothetical protein
MIVFFPIGLVMNANLRRMNNFALERISLSLTGHTINVDLHR